MFWENCLPTFFLTYFFLLPNVSVHPFSLSFNCMASLSLFFTISIYEHVYTHVLQNINWSVFMVLLIYLSLGLRIWYCNINWCVLSWGRPILLHQVFLNYIHIFVQVEASPDFPNQLWHVHRCCLLM